MREFIEIYNEHKEEIKTFLVETLHNSGEVDAFALEKFGNLFKHFKSLELIYILDKKTLRQTSPNIFANKTDTHALDRDRSYLLDKTEFDNDEIAITKPYISTATGNNCITLIKKEKDHLLLLDFDLSKLLQRLGLIELNDRLNSMTKFFYLLTGVIMGLFSVFIIGYAAVDFVINFLFKLKFDLDTIFKPIVALTLGLAIFDLAKTILEQEVFFKSYSKKRAMEIKVLTKFLISIIIALSIESLMVVFKIAIDDFTNMVNALYLITGVSLIIISLAVFIYLTRHTQKS